MTFLSRFLSINLSEIIFRNIYGKNYLTTFPKFWHMTSFWPQKWPNFDYFQQKWPILTKFTPLMTFLTRFLSINLTEITLRNFYGKIYWTTFPKFWHMTSFSPPKMNQFLPFGQKWSIFTKFTPFMTILTTFMSINVTEIIFRNY